MEHMFNMMQVFALCPLCEDPKAILLPQQQTKKWNRGITAEYIRVLYYVFMMIFIAEFIVFISKFSVTIIMRLSYSYYFNVFCIHTIPNCETQEASSFLFSFLLYPCDICVVFILSNIAAIDFCFWFTDWIYGLIM